MIMTMVVIVMLLLVVIWYGDNGDSGTDYMYDDDGCDDYSAVIHYSNDDGGCGDGGDNGDGVFDKVFFSSFRLDTHLVVGLY